MSAIVIDGRAIAQKLRDTIRGAIADWPQKPGLAVVLVGDDPASRIYVERKVAISQELGIRSFEHFLPEDTSREALQALITHLNEDADVHGILVQLPLPKHLDGNEISQFIAPHKDVDGLTALNAGKLVTGGADVLVPCTPQGVMLLLEQSVGLENLAGKHAVVIGRSLLFGKPMAQLLLQADCTVTHAHSKTQHLPSLCRQADIVIAAVGKPELVRADWLRPEAIVLDVGINRMADGSLAGDVAFAEAKEVASLISPVPGGVGPMTVACLMRNCIKAYCQQTGKEMPDI